MSVDVMREVEGDTKFGQYKIKRPLFNSKKVIKC